jgi:hypothetical protein
MKLWGNGEAERLWSSVFLRAIEGFAVAGLRQASTGMTDETDQNGLGQKIASTEACIPRPENADSYQKFFELRNQRTGTSPTQVPA